LLTAFATQAFLGALLVVGGIGQVIHAIKVGGSATRMLLGLIVSTLYLATGVLLVVHPLAGVLSSRSCSPGSSWPPA